jgi:hypothetical protein
MVASGMAMTALCSNDPPHARSSGMRRLLGVGSAIAMRLQRLRPRGGASWSCGNARCADLRAGLWMMSSIAVRSSSKISIREAGRSAEPGTLVVSEPARLLTTQREFPLETSPPAHGARGVVTAAHKRRVQLYRELRYGMPEDSRSCEKMHLRSFDN